ncbi:hypothetical protein B0H10DRAFT_1940497 [Mycena sp. CBHHK59/15]|nr:hypothetical protein B0H10DRAFT_1940497 [Mycena sp. CBHHK59/15]
MARKPPALHRQHHTRNKDRLRAAAHLRMQRLRAAVASSDCFTKGKLQKREKNRAETHAADAARQTRAGQENFPQACQACCEDATPAQERSILQDVESSPTQFKHKRDFVVEDYNTECRDEGDTDDSNDEDAQQVPDPVFFKRRVKLQCTPAGILPDMQELWGGGWLPWVRLHLQRIHGLD